MLFSIISMLCTSVTAAPVHSIKKLVDPFESADLWKTSRNFSKLPSINEQEDKPFLVEEDKIYAGVPSTQVDIWKQLSSVPVRETRKNKQRYPPSSYTSILGKKSATRARENLC
jgi:hypothetical protein